MTSLTMEPLEIQQDEELIIYFFPGNPYVYGFYFNLLDSLRAVNNLLRSKRKLRPVLINYPDISKEMLKSPSGTFDYVSNDIVRQIKLDIASYGQNMQNGQSMTETKKKCVFVAHSFGAYIANLVRLNIAKDFSFKNALEMEHFIYLFPFLQQPTLQGRVTLAIADTIYRKQNGLLADLLHEKIVTPAFNSIVCSISDSEKRKHLLTSAKRLFSIFRIAALERYEIGHKRDLSHIYQCSNTWLVYTRGDQWCTRQVVDNWSDMRKIDLSHIPHAFPCRFKHDEEIVRVLVQIFDNTRPTSQSKL